MRSIIVLAVLALLPAAQACSIANQDFTQADLGDDILLTHLGQDAVRIDMETGIQTTLEQQFFPKVGIDDDARFEVIRWQEGLGADCSGDVKLRVQGSSFTASDVRDFDITDDFLALAYNDRIDVHRLPSGAKGWSLDHEVTSEFFGAPGPVHVAISDTGAVAASTKDVLRIYEDDGIRELPLPNVGDLDWQGDKLIVAVHDEPGASFYVISDEQTLFFSVESERTGSMSVAAGKDLHFQFRNDVFVMDGAKVKQLVVPDSLQSQAVAADDDGAVVLIVEPTDHGYGDEMGILRLDGMSATDYLERPDGTWQSTDVPAIQWVDGPPVAMTATIGSEVETAGPSTESMPAPLAIVPLLLAFLARRLH